VAQTKRDRPSQGARFGEDSGTECWMDAGIREHVDLPVQEIFEVLAEPNEIAE
jgi:hypothetical protein